jgi:hypothetical protein
MARNPATFKEADLTRALKAARKAGVSVARVDIDPKTGRISIFSDIAAVDELDRELADFEAGHGKN